MNKDNIYRSVRESLEELKNRTAVISEQRSILVSELARNMIRLFPNASPEALYKEFLAATNTSDISEKLIFANVISSHFGEEKLLDSLLYESRDKLAPAGTHGKIAYIRNRYNDEAYSKFSSVVSHSKPIFCSSFEDCCEALTRDECEFTILPLEDSSDGKMFGFYSLIDRYEFKIAYVCSVEHEDSSKSIRYALASKHFRLDKPEKAKADRSRIFEFTMTHTPSNNILDIYRVASLSLAQEHRTSSLPLPYGDNMARFYHSFIITKETRFLPFLLLLSLEYPEYSPIGIYYEI